MSKKAAKLARRLLKSKKVSLADRDYFQEKVGVKLKAQITEDGIKTVEVPVYQIHADEKTKEYKSLKRLITKERKNGE